MLRKFLFWTVSGFALSGASLSAADATVMGVVNFTTCITNSKYGKKEQENFEAIRNQMTRMVEETEKELQTLEGQMKDEVYVDSLSPRAEAELQDRFRALNDDLARYQGQFYQIMQQANMQLIQKMSAQIAKASEKIAQQKKVDYVINKEACFYVRPELELTSLIIAEMDKNYEADIKSRHLSDNTEEVSTEQTDKEKSA